MVQSDLLYLSPAPRLQVELLTPTRQTEGYALCCDGVLDVYTEPVLTDTVGMITSVELGIAARPLVLDLSALRFVDIIGLRALVSAQDNLREKYPYLRTVGAQPQLRHLIEVARSTGWSPLPELLA